MTIFSIDFTKSFILQIPIKLFQLSMKLHNYTRWKDYASLVTVELDISKVNWTLSFLTYKYISQKNLFNLQLL